MPPRPQFDRDEYEDWTETQLVAQVTGNAGAAGAGAAAELTRRLMVQLREAAARSDHQAAQMTFLTRWLIGLTVALLVLTAVLVAKELS